MNVRFVDDVLSLYCMLWASSFQSLHQSPFRAQINNKLFEVQGGLAVLRMRKSSQSCDITLSKIKRCSKWMKTSPKMFRPLHNRSHSHTVSRFGFYYLFSRRQPDLSSVSHRTVEKPFQLFRTHIFANKECCKRTLCLIENLSTISKSLLQLLETRDRHLQLAGKHLGKYKYTKVVHGFIYYKENPLNSSCRSGKT